MNEDERIKQLEEELAQVRKDLDFIRDVLVENNTLKTKNYNHPFSGFDDE